LNKDFCRTTRTRVVQVAASLVFYITCLIDQDALVLLLLYNLARDRLNKIELDGESNRCRYRSNGMKRGGNRMEIGRTFMHNQI